MFNCKVKLKFVKRYNEIPVYRSKRLVLQDVMNTGKEKVLLDEVKLPHNHGEGEQVAVLQAQLDRVDYFQIVAEVFKQLGDPTRVRIFWLLCHCEECVLNISAMMKMSSPAVSHHLRPLKNSGLIVSRRKGKEVYYRAADTEQSRLLHHMIERVLEISCPEM